MAYNKKSRIQCRILWIDKNKIAFEFEGNGYIILTDNPIDKDAKCISVYFNKETKEFNL